MSFTTILNQSRFQTLKVQNSSPESAKHVQSPNELKRINIDSLRRRKLGSVFFSYLVFFKLNENLL